MAKHKKRVFTTSKKIMWVSVSFFIVMCLTAVYFSYKGYDTTVFAFVLPISGGIAGASIVFYMNKSKMENIFSYKISFLEYKLKMIKKNPELARVIDKEVTSMESTLDSKADTTMQEAVSEDITIQSYS